MTEGTSGSRSKRRYWPGALLGLGSLLALFAVFGNRLWFDRAGLSKGRAAGDMQCTQDALRDDKGSFQNGKGAWQQLDSTGRRLATALSCLDDSAQRVGSIRGDHASHILSVVHKEMIAAQELIVVATDLAHQVLALAGRHENVVLRDQLSMLKKDLGDSQQEYRRCIASHSQDNAGEVHRGYKLEPDSGPNRDVKAIERDARKRRLLNAPTTSNWLLLESLAPKPLEPFDIVYAFPGSGGSYDPLKRDWRSLAHSVRSIVTYGASLHYGTIFVLLGPVVGAEQSALQHLRGMPVRYLQGDLASSLEHFRDHFVVLQDDVSFRRTIERSALWETSESWGALVALGVEPEQCWNKLTDALLDNVVASPGYKREARRCTTLQPIALNKPVVLHLLRTLVGPLPISSVRNCCDGSVDLVHLFAHWMYEHNLLGRATQDSRDVAISKDNEVDGGVSAQQGPLFMIGGRSTRELV